jgi:hypothetical protein
MQLSMLFEGLTSKKATAKEIKTAIKEEMERHPRYQEVIETLRTWKAELKMIEQMAKDKFQSEASELEILQDEMESDKLMMTDLAVSMLNKGESTEFEYKGNKYYAHFSVNIKRI